MTEPYLTAADFRVLRLMFRDANRQGRLDDTDYDRTVVVLGAAEHYQRQQDRQMAEATR